MYTNGLKDRFGSPLVSQKDVEQQISQSLDNVNERIALAEENLSKASEDLSSKADLVLDNTFSGEQVFGNDVTFGKTIYLNNVEDPDMSTTLDGSSLSTTNVTTFTINNNDLTFNDTEIVIGDKILTFDGEDEVIPANSVTDEARMFARVAQESAAIAEEGASVASSAAIAADTSATNASQSATVAAESAGQITEVIEKQGDDYWHWNAFYMRQTDMNSRFMCDLGNAYAGIKNFNYALNNLKIGDHMFRYNRALKKFSTTNLLNLESAFWMFGCTTGWSKTEWTYDLPKLTNASYMFAHDGEIRQIQRFAATLPKLEKGDNMFLAQAGLVRFESDLPALQSGTLMFSLARLDKESALRVLTTIPTYTSGSHPLTIGIHIDHKTDEEVLAAIDAATAKGWTVTTQWNGTATSSTFDLRPTPTPPVYAKCVQSEYSWYIDATNTRYSVEWGHVITSPDDKSPEELGYQQFNSLEEALNQWGLTEYMEIPQEEQNNN